MSGEILDPRGVPATLARTQMEEPRGSSPYFGWVDAAGDPCSVRMDCVNAVMRDTRTGKFVVLLANTGNVFAIDDKDAVRLMKRMGWKFEEAAAAA